MSYQHCITPSQNGQKYLTQSPLSCLTAFLCKYIEVKSICEVLVEVTMDHSGMVSSEITKAGLSASHFGHYDCDGNPVSHSTGSWKGHVGPGVIFITWALHWWVSAVVLSKKDRGHVSRGWYPPLFRGLKALEPILKIFGPFFGLAMELRLDHSEWQ
jgi:hypothetical protein